MQFNHRILVLWLATFLLCSCATIEHANKRSNCHEILKSELLEIENYVKDAKSIQEQNGENWDANEGVETTPSSLFKRFIIIDQSMSKIEAKGCPTARYYRFDSSSLTFAEALTFIKKRELNRVAALNEIEKQNEKIAKERDMWEANTNRLAKKRGYNAIIFNLGLTEMLDQVIQENTPITDLRKTVIELDEVKDPEFIALQVLPNHTVIYTSRYSNAVVMLRNYRKQVLEGSSLTSLDNSCVVLKGLQIYKTSISTRQAFVIETAW